MKREVQCEILIAVKSASHFIELLIDDADSCSLIDSDTERFVHALLAWIFLSVFPFALFSPSKKEECI